MDPDPRPFVFAGKVLCCAYLVVGIGLFAIPIGTVFESFQDVLAGKAETAANKVCIPLVSNSSLRPSPDGCPDGIAGTSSWIFPV